MYSIYRLDHKLAAGFVPHCPRSPYILYGNSTDPDPQLYHVIL